MNAGHPDFYRMTEEENRLYSKKNKDYAQGGNPMGNFMRVGNILSNYPGLNLKSPTVVALVYMMKQLDSALWMLSNKYEGEVENIDTRLQDVSIYAKLARILHNMEVPKVEEPLESQWILPGALDKAC
uniref:Terminase n=1 Tax=viral metagenome TaxID=1070528 RepID=A0A6M3L6D5_9ZZZZ